MTTKRPGKIAMIALEYLQKAVLEEFEQKALPGQYVSHHKSQWQILPDPGKRGLENRRV
jgi:hypothetical protein